jgi:hypothetical protein
MLKAKVCLGEWQDASKHALQIVNCVKKCAGEWHGMQSQTHRTACSNVRWACEVGTQPTSVFDFSATSLIIIYKNRGYFGECAGCWTSVQHVRHWVQHVGLLQIYQRNACQRVAGNAHCCSDDLQRTLAARERDYFHSKQHRFPSNQLHTKGCPEGQWDEMVSSKGNRAAWEETAVLL